MKAYPDPTAPPVAPIDPHAVDVIIEQHRFDQDAARRVEVIRSAQARSVDLGFNLSKICLAGYVQICSSNLKLLRSKTYLFSTKAQSLSNSQSRKQSTQWWLTFFEIGPSVTVTLVSALTKLSTSQDAVDNHLNGTSKKFDERNTGLTNQLNVFLRKKISRNGLIGGPFTKSCTEVEFFGG